MTNDPFDPSQGGLFPGFFSPGFFSQGFMQGSPWLLYGLQVSYFQRYAAYAQSMLESLRDGTLDPNNYIDSYATLATGLIEDTGAFMMVASGIEVPAMRDTVPRYQVQADSHEGVQQFVFDVPIWAFEDCVDIVELQASPFLLALDGFRILPGVNFHLEYTHISLQDRIGIPARVTLPDSLRQHGGDVMPGLYVGQIWGLRTRAMRSPDGGEEPRQTLDRIPIALVEIDVNRPL